MSKIITQKKIAILVPSLRVGGAEQLIYQEISHLQKNDNITIDLHVIFEEGPLYNKFANSNINVKVWNSPHKSLKMIYIYFKIIMYLRKYKYDVLHTHLVDSYGPWVGRIARIKKVIATVHNDVRYSIVERIGLTRSDVLIACGAQVEENVKKFANKNKVVRLNNATSVKAGFVCDMDKLNREYGINPGDIVLLSFGRLTEQKGYEYLINAFHIAHKSNNKLVLLIGGDGELRGGLENLIKENNDTQAIKILGEVADVHELYSRAEIYINSSLWEGLPMTLIEAIGYGKPVIATNVGGNSEIVKNNKSGLLVESRDIDSMAHAISKLVDDQELRRKFSSEALCMYRENYSIEEHCEKLYRLYTDD